MYKTSYPHCQYPYRLLITNFCPAPQMNRMMTVDFSFYVFYMLVPYYRLTIQSLFFYYALLTSVGHGKTRNPTRFFKLEFLLFKKELLLTS